MRTENTLFVVEYLLGLQPILRPFLPTLFSLIRNKVLGVTRNRNTLSTWATSLYVSIKQPLYTTSTSFIIPIQIEVSEFTSSSAE